MSEGAAWHWAVDVVRQSAMSGKVLHNAHGLNILPVLDGNNIGVCQTPEQVCLMAERPQHINSRQTISLALWAHHLNRDIAVTPTTAVHQAIGANRYQGVHTQLTSTTRYYSTSHRGTMEG